MYSLISMLPIFQNCLSIMQKYAPKKKNHDNLHLKHAMSNLFMRSMV